VTTTAPRAALSTTAALALLFCCSIARSADDARELVATQNQLAFYSPFWQNLHHVLYAEAWRKRGVEPARSNAGTLPEPGVRRTIAGEVVHEALAARKIDYTQYLYSTGLFDRAWPQFEPTIEHNMPAFVAGKTSLADAMHALVAEAPEPAPRPPR